MSLHAYHVHWKILSVICLNFGGSSFADKPNFNASTLIFLLWLLHSSSSSRILLLSHFSDTTSNSHVRLFVIPWTVAHRASTSMEFSRQEYWSGLPFPSPGDLPDPGIEPGSPALRADALQSEPPRNPLEIYPLG